MDKDNKQDTPVVDATPSTTTPTEDKKGGNSTDTKKTFTQDEVNAIVGERVKEINTKNETIIQEAVSNAIAEAERKAKLTQEEKEKEERTKREAEMQEKERNITLRERRIEAQDMLLDKHIPIKLVDFVVDIDATKMKDNIEILAKEFSKAVEDGVTNKLKGTPIEDFSNSQDTPKPKEMPSHF